MSTPITRHYDLVILGGGFAGVYAAQRVAKRLGKRSLSIGLIASENHMVFQPMLPEVVGGSLSPRHVVNPIRLICRETEVLKGRVCSVDLAKKVINVDGGAFTPNVNVTFDQLVFAMGADVDLTRIPGMTEHAYLMRNAGDAMKLRAAIISRMEEANLITDAQERKRLLSFVVVGGGYSGVETAGQMQDLIRGVQCYYENIRLEDTCVSLVHSGSHLLPMLSTSLADYTKGCLIKMGVNVVLNQRVRAATARSILLADGTKLTSSLIVCTVGNAPHPVIAQLGESGALPVERGKIIVESTGRVKGQDKLWAAGDCCLFPKADGGHCPETAQFAYRQGQLIGDNISAALQGSPLKSFTFTGLGELASIGHHMAVANIAGINFSGIVAWFMWRTIYLMKLPGFDRKLRVMTEWAFELFFPRDISLLTPQYTSPLREMHLEPGDPLFESGEPAFSLYAVKSGRVDITDANGDVVKSAGPGDHFGERALLGDRIWRFDASARESSELVVIESRVFDKLITIQSLRNLFLRTAENYALPEQVDQTVAAMAATVRDGTVADVMTRDITTINADATIHTAIDEFQSHPHSTYPVLDADGKVLGLLRRAAAYEWLKHHGLDCQHTVRDIALTRPFIIQPTIAIRDLVEDFMHTGATKAMVMDNEGKLQGMVTVFDLLKGKR
jgi:NADH dehydrogenase